MKNQYKRTLTIAGSDSSGGAGIQADLKTFSALGCYGMSVITALTAQNTTAVMAIHPAPVDFIAAQIEAVLTDIGVDAVKIGMLHSPEVIDIVAKQLLQHKIDNIILDPVMVAKSGDTLIQDDAVDALRKTLVPMATVITPNLPEAEIFLARKIGTEKEMEQACRDLGELGPKAVLLKGGHLTENNSNDMLYDVNSMQFSYFNTERLNTPNTHGTGCTLSSAVTAGIAHGQSLQQAVANAKNYINGAIAAGSNYEIGKGHGPVHHFYQWWK